jgi:ribosome-associated protein
MEHHISRTEKKIRARSIENLAKELVELPTVNVKNLPCDDFIKQEITHARGLKAGARKRQIKYITKNLRQLDPEPLLDFLAKEKGSKLKENNIFHNLERLRDDIIAEAFNDLREAEKYDKKLDSSWHSETIDAALHEFPSLDKHNLKDAAIKFAVTTKPVFKREIFRILKAGHERHKFD